VELLKQIEATKNATESAVDVLVALAIKFSSDETVTKAVNSCAKAAKKMAESTTIDAIQKLVTHVERSYQLSNINKSQARSLVMSILEFENFNLK
jgi:negative regulator of replication initiation